MDKLAAPTGGSESLRVEKWIWGLIAVLGAALLAIGIINFPRVLAVYEIYWGQDNIRRLFYEDLGLSYAWSSFIAVVGSFFYALAWIPLLGWTFRILAWRFNSRQLIIAFVSWVFVYGHVPLLHALLGSDACFNQRTGKPLKWYAEGPDGDIILFDSPGYDTLRGVEKHPVTPETCTIFARQKNNARPHRVTANPTGLEFFDPINGQPRIWYYKTSDDAFELFDSRGFHPVTSEPLLPVTKEIVGQILAKEAGNARTRAEEAAARRRAEEAETKKRAEEAAVRRRAEDAEARKRAEDAEAKRRAEEAEARKRAEDPAARRNAEAVEAKRRTDETSRTVAPTALSPSIGGLWRGKYFYPDGRTPVDFAFQFDTSGGSCRGRSEEPNTFGDPRAPKLYANLQCGSMRLAPGQVVAITKIYDGTGGVSHAVLYSGTVSADLNQITGEWAIGATRGSFYIQR